ncbi:MAG TPA: FMN-binding protein [Candidatus Acidoferrum sp.]|nr:FMN-binding protein [Candidatus Acidoferrum sp.]
MKRATIVTGVTVLGVAWLLNYKVAPHQFTALPPASPTQSPAVPDSPTPSPAATSSPSVSPSGAPTPSPSPSPTALNGTFTGADVPNRFGDVQVRVVISSGRITDVQAVQLPTDRAESAYISQQVGPWLRTEALQAQSANIDIISGATYTSQSYAQSLESALQQAHLG